MRIFKKIIKKYIEEIKSDDDFNSLTENKFYSNYGYALSTKELTDTDKQKIFLHFQYKEKAKIALSVASSYPGGDYFEFGSHDLYTLRNFLSAFDVGNLDIRFPTTKFYAFDIFGTIEDNEKNYFDKNGYFENDENYFKNFIKDGDVENKYYKYLKKYGLFYDRITLVKGFFEKTLPNFKYDGKIGFVCLDCNIIKSYQTVLNWLEDKLTDGMYIYIDEYFDGVAIKKKKDYQSCIYYLFEDFREKAKSNGLDVAFVRSAASVGALFKCFKKY